MDVVSHLLLARMVAALRTSRAGVRGVVAATVVGGIAPDVDAVLTAFGWDVYLRWHDAGTHAIVGTPLAALLAAAAVRPWSPAPFGALVRAGWFGALSHVAFDLYSGASIRILWPFSHHLFTTPVVAMADPLAIAAVVAGAVALWVWPREARTAGVLTMALLTLLCAVKLVTRARAVTAYERTVAGAPIVGTVLEASWGSWRGWRVFDRLADGRVRAFAADGWSGDVRPRFSHAGNHEEPFAHLSLAQFATARNFVAAHPFAFATRRETDGGAVVFWSDARYCWPASERTDPQEGVPHQDVRPAIGDVRCALWFGGSLDAQGQPREALVWLGGHLQRRRTP